MEWNCNKINIKPVLDPQIFGEVITILVIWKPLTQTDCRNFISCDLHEDKNLTFKEIIQEID